MPKALEERFYSVGHILVGIWFCARKGCVYKMDKQTLPPCFKSSTMPLGVFSRAGGGGGKVWVREEGENKWKKHPERERRERSWLVGSSV